MEIAVTLAATAEDTTDPEDRLDRGLLVRFRVSGDRAALAALAQRHLDPAYRVAARLTSPAEAGDIVHDAWLRLVPRVGQFRGTGSVRSWILACVANEARRWSRRHGRERRRREPLGDLPQPTSTPLAAEERAALRAEVDALPPRYRLALALRFLDGLSFADAAAALRCPEKTVRTRVERGLDRLCARLRRRGLAIGAAVAAGSLAGEARAEAPPSLGASVSGAIHAAPATAASAAMIAAVAAMLVLGVTATVATGLGWLSGDAPRPVAADAPAEAAPDRVAFALASPIDLELRRDRLGELAQLLRWALPDDRRIAIEYPRVLEHEPWEGFVGSFARKPLKEVLDAVTKQAGLRWRRTAAGVAIDRPMAPETRPDCEQALAGADPEAVTAAAHDLAASGDDELLAPLLRAVTGTGEHGRKALLGFSLGFDQRQRIDPVPAAIPALIDGLRDRSRPLGERLLFAHLLGAMRAASAVGPLIDLAKASAPAAAAEGDRGGEGWSALLGAVRSLSAIGDAEAVRGLLDLVDHATFAGRGEDAWRQLICACLLRARHARGLELAQGLVDRSQAGPEVLDELAEWRDEPRAGGLLVAACPRSAGNARAAAIEALAKRGDDAAVPTLVALAGDGDEGARWDALCALARIDRPAARDALLAALGDGSMFGQYGSPTWSSWRLCRDARVRALAKRAMVAADPQHRFNAENALLSLPGDATELIMAEEAQRPGAASRCAGMAATARIPGGVDRLLAAAREAQPDRQERTAMACDLIASRDPRSTAEVTRLLEKWGDPTVVNQVIQILVFNSSIESPMGAPDLPPSLLAWMMDHVSDALDRAYGMRNQLLPRLAGEDQARWLRRLETLPDPITRAIALQGLYRLQAVPFLGDGSEMPLLPLLRLRPRIVETMNHLFDDLFKHADADVRCWALIAATQFQRDDERRSYADRLLALVERDPVARVRALAADGLIASLPKDDAAHVARLRQRLKVEPDRRVRTVIAERLEHGHDTPAVSRALSQLQEHPEDETPPGAADF